MRSNGKDGSAASISSRSTRFYDHQGVDRDGKIVIFECLGVALSREDRSSKYFGFYQVAN